MIFVHWNIHVRFLLQAQWVRPEAFSKRCCCCCCRCCCCCCCRHFVVICWNPPNIWRLCLCCFASYVLFRKHRSFKDLTQSMRIEVSSPSAPNMTVWPLVDFHPSDSRCSFGLPSWCGALHWKNGGRWRFTFSPEISCGKKCEEKPMGCWSIRFGPSDFFWGYPKTPFVAKVSINTS